MSEQEIEQSIHELFRANQPHSSERELVDEATRIDLKQHGLLQVAAYPFPASVATEQGCRPAASCCGEFLLAPHSHEAA